MTLRADILLLALLIAIVVEIAPHLEGFTLVTLIQ
jgi:hypothetical protein